MDHAQCLNRGDIEGNAVKLSELIEHLQGWLQGFIEDPEVLVWGTHGLEATVTGAERDTTYAKPVLFLNADNWPAT